MKTINYFDIAKSLKGGLFKSFQTDLTPDFLILLYNKCEIKPNDTITDKLFKCVILKGSITEARNYLNDIGCRTPKGICFVQSDIGDYLFYKKASDLDITIIAKTIYYHTNKNMEFLKWQIDKLIVYGDIDIKQEHINYGIQKYGNDYKNHLRIPEDSMYEIV